MKEFSSELGQAYASYTFGYAQYARREPGDALSTLYAQGYLPYSGSPDVGDVHYRARSARVPLAQFSLTSENRRIAKKFDHLLLKERVPAGQFSTDEAFMSFCLDYFLVLHGERAMSRARLLHILQCGLVTSVVVYREPEGAPAAYVLEVAEGPMGHYWFSFYRPQLVKQSLGMWLMLDAIRDAKERGLAHYYLGTVYGEKALYKANFEPLEWWDGESWNHDTAALKERSRSDASRPLEVVDLWKGALEPFA